MKVLTKVIEDILALKGKGSLKSIDKNCEDAIGTNRNLLMRLIKDNKDTEYGKKYNFKDIKSIDDFRKNVPFSDYDTYAPYIERMVKKGEKNLITSYKVTQYAETSGSVGVQKKIPVTDESIRIYTKYTITRVSALAKEHYKKVLNKKLPYGKGLNTLESEVTLMEDGKTPRGSISGTAAKKYKKLFPYYLTSPIPVLFPEGGMVMQYMKARFALEDKDMTFIFSVFMTNIVDILGFIKNNWEVICDDIENGTINNDFIDDCAVDRIKPYIKKNPQRAKELREIFSQGFDNKIVTKIWPNLSWVCAIGSGGFATYTEKFRNFGADVPIDFSIYGASEGMFAACRQMGKPEFVLLTDSCFYEFLPADATDDDNNTLTLDQLEVGKEYEIIITNQCGFYRYKIKDVIKVLGFYKTCPVITFSYRKNQLVNVAAEKTTEAHLSKAMEMLGKEIGCNFYDFALYVDEDAPKYVMLGEPDRELDVKKNEQYSEAFEKIMCEVNKEYEFIRGRRSLQPAKFLIQQQQTHLLWKEFKIAKGSSPNQVKPVRILDVPQKENFFFGLLEEGQEK